MFGFQCYLHILSSVALKAIKAFKGFFYTSSETLTTHRPHCDVLGSRFYVCVSLLLIECHSQWL